jgi:hypothetical protein
VNAEGSARTDEPSVDAVSVAELIRRRLDPSDPWRLALVQRHLVWDEVRMRRLLDSLLAGYPIGTILLCRVQQPAKVLIEIDGTRRATPARPGTWQLLDGQQRINALVCIFTQEGRFGRFYLDMTAKREREDVVTRRRDKRQTTRYIVWREDEEGAGGDAVPERDLYIDLSRWHRWAEAKSPDRLVDLATQLDVDESFVATVLNEIDPAFREGLDAKAVPDAASRTSRLLRMWTDEAIPVQRLTLEDPIDVLQVFTRINLEGVRLDGEDVFFAAVKTLWPDAEENLDRVAARSVLINRLTGLRLLARLANRALSQGDLMPLRVDALNGPRGERLVETMRRIARDDSPALGRLARLGQWLVAESGIGYGLNSINPLLLDHVFGWAAVNVALDDAQEATPLMRPAAEFLVGAQAFRYQTILGDTFSRSAFGEAIAAGAAGGPFPLDRVVTAARSRWPDLRIGQRWVPPNATADNQRAVVDSNAGLFLSIAQGLPFTLPSRFPDRAQPTRQVEWDHIWPQARADRMRVRHPETNYPVHHELRRLVWHVGNLWALDRPLNNRASDALPSEKFVLLRGAGVIDATLPTRWPDETAAFLTASELEDLQAAEVSIVGKRVEEGMPLFARFVRGRADRIYSSVVSQFPGMLRFAPEAEVEAGGFAEAPAEGIDHALGVDVPEATHEPVSDDVGSGQDADATVFESAASLGLGEPLRDVLSTARSLGLPVRLYKSSVMVTPPGNRSRMLFTLWPRHAGGGGFTIYRWAPAFAEFFPGVDVEEARRLLGEDGMGELAPSDVPGFLTGLRSLLEGSSGAGPTVSDDLLTGDEIREAALAFLWDADAERAGIHYYRITDGVLAVGAVAGKDPHASVRNAIASSESFEQTAAGTYTWRVAGPQQAPRSGRRYWVMRTDRNRAAEIWAEVQGGRLRQGWGWDPEMNLELIDRKQRAGEPLTEWQQLAWGNRRMLTSQPDGIHVGDIILAVHLPSQGQLTVLRVIGGYEFDGGQLLGDCGHILPVEIVPPGTIRHNDPRLSPRLQGALGNRIRLWNIDGLQPDLMGILAIDPSAAEAVGPAAN